MSAIRILVVEDDPFIAQEISDYLFELGYLVTGIAKSYDQALRLLENSLPDLILLDIELQGEQTGVDLAKTIRKEQWPLPIVFLSAQTDPRIIDSVKQTQPDGFIVKPFDERDLQTNIEIALYRYSQEGTVELGNVTVESFVMNNFYFIRSQNQLLKIDSTDIIWLEADDSYTHIHLEDEKHTLSSSLKQVAAKLPQEFFIRIHRSYVINLNYLNKLEDQYVYVGPKALPVSRSYKKALMERLSLL